MPKIVEVLWEDAVAESGYYNNENPEQHTTSLCKQVGYLIKKDKGKIIVFSQHFDDGAKRHIHTIPRGMVRSIKELH